MAKHLFTCLVAGGALGALIALPALAQDGPALAGRKTAADGIAAPASTAPSPAPRLAMMDCVMACPGGAIAPDAAPGTPPDDTGAFHAPPPPFGPPGLAPPPGASYPEGPYSQGPYSQGPYSQGPYSQDPETGGAGEPLANAPLANDPLANDPLALAGNLATLETYIGITSTQLDAWRGYTDALQALMAMPTPAQAAPTEAAPTDAAPAAGADPLPGEQLAGELVARGDEARQLIAAIGTLRGALSKAQLARFAEAGPLCPPQFTPPGAPRPGFPPPPR